MRQHEPGRGDPIGPLDWLRLLPHEPAASSDRLGWVGLEAARYRAEPAFEVHPPALTHHWLILVTGPPEELDLRYEGVKRHVPPPAGTVSLVPAGSPHWVRASGLREQMFIFLEPGLVAQVAAEAFGLDPARLTVPPLAARRCGRSRASSGGTVSRAGSRSNASAATRASSPGSRQMWRASLRPLACHRAGSRLAPPPVLKGAPNTAARQAA